LQVLAPEANVVPADNFLITRHRHTGRDVAYGCGGKVSDFLKESGSGSGRHLLDWGQHGFCGMRGCDYV
jgi:hypothetical protein